MSMSIADPAVKAKIKGAKVLAVGAGGIGCELLKTLALTGFEDMETIDMDTIETSNLNRQFLFRKHHVGQSKAQVAVESVRKFRPNAKLTAHHGNIKDSQFGTDFFQRFDVVLNGLDNLEARKHVNRLCLAAETPLVESGTAGYLGQVTVHLKGRTECFECQPKPTPKTFPVCTIRNHPDRPIHCVVWAKDLLFTRLFGKPDVSDLDEPQQGAEGEGSGEGEQAAEDPAEVASFFVKGEGETSAEYSVRVFKRVFHSDIHNLLAMEDLWKTRAKPTPLDLDALVPDPCSLPSGSGFQSAAAALGLADSHAEWSTEESARVMVVAVRMFLEGRAAEVGAAVFDKDDDLAVDFVAAASNLRATNFAIPTQSKFHCKGMAGNIVHAIATTNAIISGLIVVEAIKILTSQLPACRDTFCQQFPSGKKMLMPVQPAEPSAKCYVCSKARLSLQIDTTKTTLGQLIDGVVKKRMGVNEPMLMTAEGLFYEEGEGVEDEAASRRMLAQPLCDLPGGGIQHNTQLQVEDCSQSLEVIVLVIHRAEWDEEQDPDGYVLSGEVPAATAADSGSAPADEGPAGADDDDDDDDIIVAMDAPEPTACSAEPSADKKRKRAADGEEGANGGGSDVTDKKMKAQATAGSDEDDDILEIID